MRKDLPPTITAKFREGERPPLLRRHFAGPREARLAAALRLQIGRRQPAGLGAVAERREDRGRFLRRAEDPGVAEISEGVGVVEIDEDLGVAEIMPSSDTLVVTCRGFPPLVVGSTVLLANLFRAYRGKLEAVVGWEEGARRIRRLRRPARRIACGSGRRSSSCAAERYKAFYYLLIKRFVYAKLRRIRPAAVFAACTPDGLFFAASFLACRRLKIPFRRHTHDLWLENTPAGGFHARPGGGMGADRLSRGGQDILHDGVAERILREKIRKGLRPAPPLRPRRRGNPRMRVRENDGPAGDEANPLYGQHQRGHESRRDAAVRQGG